MAIAKHSKRDDAVARQRGQGQRKPEVNKQGSHGASNEEEMFARWQSYMERKGYGMVRLDKLEEGHTNDNIGKTSGKTTVKSTVHKVNKQGPSDKSGMNKDIVTAQDSSSMTTIYQRAVPSVIVDDLIPDHNKVRERGEQEKRNQNSSSSEEIDTSGENEQLKVAIDNIAIENFIAGERAKADQRKQVEQSSRQQASRYVEDGQVPSTSRQQAPQQMPMDNRYNRQKHGEPQP